MTERTCSIDGCDYPHEARGYCVTHYWRLMRGIPIDAPLVRRGRTEADRFWAKVDKDGPIPEFAPDLGPCWIWVGAIAQQTGYGAFGVRRGVDDWPRVNAHRWAYLNEVGPIPEGLELDHLCRVRACVRPTHLEAVTHLVNVRRGFAAVMAQRRAGG